MVTNSRGMHPMHPHAMPRGKSFGQTRLSKSYSNVFLNSSCIKNSVPYVDSRTPPRWVRMVERQASPKGQGRAGKKIPRNKNTQEYQDFLQEKINKLYKV